MPRGPEKFEGVPEEIPIEEIYAASLEGGAIEEIGSVDELGYYALVPYSGRWYILSEDSQGFVDAEEFDSEREARSAWERIERAYQEFNEATEFARGGAVRGRRRRRLGGRRMQAGGVVEGPVEALVGEAGPEAVVPLDAHKANTMAARMAHAAEEAAEDAEAVAAGDHAAEVRRVLEALADFAEEAAEEAEQAAEEAAEAADEGETAEAAAAATEAAALAEDAVAASDAAREIADEPPRRRGLAAAWWG